MTKSIAAILPDSVKGSDATKLKPGFGVFGRFLSIVLPLIILCFFVGIWIYQIDEADKAKSGMNRKLNFITQNHAIVISDLLARKQYDEVAVLAANLLADPDIEYIEVVDLEGNLIDLSGEKSDSPDLLEKSVIIDHTDKNGIRFVGEMIVGINQDRYLSDLESKRHAALIFSLGLLISVLIASSAAYWWSVGLPLKKLTRAIQVSRAGGKHIPLIYSGRDQLGIVMDEYNQMQRAAEENKIALMKHQLYLEQRTLDLQDELESHAETSRKLEYEASHDSLTSLPNRNTFSNLTKVFVQSARKSGRKGALCFFDLDRFKLANDTYGHQAGDALLVSVVKKIQSIHRPEDVLARLGGDEFGLLMLDISVEEATDLCQRIVDAINQHRYIRKRHHLYVGMSAGIAIIDGQSGDYDQLLKIADLGCYMAKNAGGGRLHFNADDSPEARSHSESLFWIQEVETAIEQNRLELWMQPIQPTRGGSDSSWVELLVRCRSKTGKVYPAGEFLPIAEHFGIVQNIDRWVVDTLVDALCEQPENMHEKISINLSGQSISDTLFLKYLYERIEVVKVHAHRLCFEITETAFISNFKNASELMNQLRAIGCTFALDDFGSGSSSFEYLKNLRFEYLKIDGNYIMDIADNPRNKEVVKAMKAIADTFSLETIAECIEDDEALKIVESLGIQNVQGYLLGRPEPLFAAVTTE